jgi:hypothetical protein
MLRNTLTKQLEKTMERITIDGFKSSLERGAYAWPGGYPTYYVCQDGGVLSFDAAHENKDLICEAMKEGFEAEWIVVAQAINWEDGNLICDHSNKRIESAYAE